MDLIGIDEIDNIKFVRSPHAEELERFGKEWASMFRGFGEEDLKKVSRLIGGKVDELEIDEEWALTKEFFPEVRVHISYHYHGEEFSNHGGEDMLQFLFSGRRVKSVTGEDLSGMIDVMLSFIGRFLSGVGLDEGRGRKKLPEKYYMPRKEAVDLLDMDNEEEREKLANFLGGQIKTKNSKMVLEKELFQNVIVEIDIADDNLENFFLLDKDRWLTNYEQNALIIYTLNHIIRFVAQKYSNQDLPKFCSKVFP